MSAWDVYWVMQMDSIIDGIGAVAVISVLACIAGFFIAGAVSEDCDSSEKDVIARNFCIWAAFCAMTFAVCVIACTFLPSTKTLAAMYVLPAVANNEKLGDDMEEIYTLGVEKLKEVLGE